MPVHRAGMLEAPVDGDPARPPRLQAQIFRPHGVATDVEDIEILSGENVPVAVEEGAAQMLRQRFELAAILDIVGVNGVVVEARANEVVVTRIVQLGTFVPWRRRMIDPQRLDPGVTDIPGVTRAGHARLTSLHRTAVARGQKLPLFQGEVRQLIETNEEKLGALVAINVIFVAAETEARGRVILPGHDMLRLVVALVQRARHIATKVRE
jgi:hypothetical protein